MTEKINPKTTTSKKPKKPSKDCFDNCDVLMEEFETFNQAFEPHSGATPPKPNPTTIAPGLKEIGRAGWTVLHTFAAYYPEAPSTTEKLQALSFLGSFAALFPCSHCGSEFKEIMEESAPQVNSRHEFSQWMCNAHNSVNESLGKPLFDCSQVDKRWRREKKDFYKEMNEKNA